MKIKKIKLYLITAFLVNVLLCQSYVIYFLEPIKNEEWAATGSFNSIIIPDSYIFQRVAESIANDQIVVLVAGSDTATEFKNVNYFYGILWWASRVQNTIVPSLFWAISNYSWNIATYINSILVLITSIYIFLLSTKIGIKKHSAYYISVVYILLPITLYNSIGFVKEIPTAAFITIFVYHFINKQKAVALLFAMLLVLTRYQLFAVIVLFYFVSILRKPIIFTIIILFIISAIYPSIDFNILASNAADTFRKQHVSTLNVGALIEQIRNEIPIASFLAILIRVMQSVYEPIITLILNRTNPQFNNVLVLSYLISNIVLVNMWTKSLIYVFIKKNLDRNMSLIYSIFIIYVILVGGFSFISHRYLFGIIPIMMVIASKFFFNVSLQNFNYNTHLNMNRNV